MEGVAEDDPQEGGPRRPAFTVRRKRTRLRSTCTSSRPSLIKYDDHADSTSQFLDWFKRLSFLRPVRKVFIN
jgi:hypothetical protein